MGEQFLLDTDVDSKKAYPCHGVPWYGDIW